MKNLLTITLLLLATFTYGQITTVGIIGSATPNGWDADSTMTQDGGDPDVWTTSMDLVTGEAKFRANDAWDINWGESAFPSGTGIQGGPNIPVPGGSFDITFNSASGDYNFVYTGPTFGSIGIIGDATPGGWDNDTDMTADPNAPWVYVIDEITLTDGAAKFRENDDWAVNWGATDFPSGVGTQGGDNIPIVAGDYKVTLNAATGEYWFEFLIPLYDSISIIGEGAPSGDWGVDDYLVKDPNDPQKWSLQATFNDGEAKIRANTDWAVNWGNTGFPLDTGVQDGPNIPVVAGEYLLEFNSTTGEYNFKDPLQVFTSIGIIGDATPGGWDNDTDMYQDPNAPDQWRLTTYLANGELKFRADDDWAVNWGDTGFPTGTGVQDGPNIPVFEGVWTINFDATTGVYSFSPASVGTIGPASPTAGWDSDEDLAGDSGTSGLFTGVQDLTAGEIKMRKDDDWAVNWGTYDPDMLNMTFPDGPASQDGPNIMVDVAGTYMISLQMANEFAAAGEYNGDYSFSIMDGVNDPFIVNQVKIIPNPAFNTMRVEIEGVELQGETEVNIFDMTGKLMTSGKFDTNDNITFNVSNYNAGFYIVQMRGEGFIVSKRFVVAK